MKSSKLDPDVNFYQSVCSLYTDYYSLDEVKHSTGNLGKNSCFRCYMLTLEV